MKKQISIALTDRDNVHQERLLILGYMKDLLNANSLNNMENDDEEISSLQIGKRTILVHLVDWLSKRAGLISIQSKISRNSGN